jgi:hypothetical protein
LSFPLDTTFSSWPSGISSAKRQTSSAAPLAAEVELFLSRELNQLCRLCPDPTPGESLPIYREAFSALIPLFPDYSNILSQIKQHYDLALLDVSRLEHSVRTLRTENGAMKELLEQSVEKANTQAKAQQMHLESLVASLQVQLSAAKEQVGEKMREIEKLHIKHRSHQVELDEALSRNLLLSSTVRDTTVRHGKSENDRLQHLCAALETKIKHDELTKRTSVEHPLPKISSAWQAAHQLGQKNAKKGWLVVGWF